MTFRLIRHADVAPQSSPQSSPQASPSGEQAARGTRQAWLLAVCCVAQFMVILDLTIVNVALPSIQNSLNFSPINLQWVVDIYAIVFAGFLMLGGRASDRFGRRNSMIAALALFALASLAGGSAIDQGMLVGARAAQGLSGALMAAASLAAITSAFPPGPARHRAIGLWGAMNGAGGAAGALFGGIITQELGWRWVLLINPPIGIAAAIVAFLVITDDGHREKAKFDLAGALTLTGGQVILAWGFINGGNLGWTAPLALGPIVAGFLILGLFTLIEARWAANPLVPVKTISKSLRSANLVVLAFSAALFPMWYLSSLYLQQVLGLSPLLAGLAFLPMALTILVVARQAGKLVGSFGVRRVLTGGLLMMASGMLLLARIGPSGSAVGFIIFPGILVAAGIALSIVPSTIAATQGATPAQAGLASGLVNTSRQIGGALGIALIISIATSYTSHLIGANKPVPNSLTDGFRVGYLIGAGLVLLAAIMAFSLLRQDDSAAIGLNKIGPGLRLPVTVAAVIVVFFAVDFAFAGSPGAPLGHYDLKNTYSFVTEPGLHPPLIETDRAPVTKSLEPGYILLTNFYDLTNGELQGQSGPLILDNKLQPVWFKPVPTNVIAADLAEQTYRGQPVLSWWQGAVTDTGATTSGEYLVVNNHYKTIATLKGADGWILTLHSMVVNGDDAWVTANKDIPMDLGKYGGVRDGALTDSAVQEYNLKTGKLVYSWDALKHIPLSDSHALAPGNSFPWDAYHVNSISLNGDGSFIVSMRNTWAAYDVNVATGNIIWTLGGKHSSFKFGSNAQFQWQHDVVLESGSQVSLFDDHCCQLTGAGTYLASNGPSRALVLKLKQASHTATVAAQYTRNSPDAAYMGNTEVLPNGNVFVGWGEQPYFSEYSKSGKLLLDGELPGPDLSYRAVAVQSWSGMPATPPAGAVRAGHGTSTVYASWNGATAIKSWRVLAGTSSGDLTAVATKGKTGFETAITVGADYQAYRVQALDGKGRVIGSSRVFSRKG
jgi:EmrB/QacA subfamily drug resistance transporter